MSSVSAAGKSVTFTGIGAGGWFGEGSLLKSEARKYDIVALRDTRMAWMPRSTFDWLLSTSIAFNRFLLLQLNERLGQFIGLVEYERMLEPDARVARCLAEMFNPRLYPGHRSELEISQEEIGYLVRCIAAASQSGTAGAGAREAGRGRIRKRPHRRSGGAAALWKLSDERRGVGNRELCRDRDRPAAGDRCVFTPAAPRARNEEDEVYQLLSDAYNDFLRVAIDNPDLHLRSDAVTPDLSPEQQERMLLIFDMLISLLERAFLTAHSDQMTPAQRRRWNSWEDFMREWLQRDAFFYRLPHLLKGEDPEFAAYFQRLAHEVRGIELPR